MSVKYCRLFFWFKGVDPKRPGGAWWYRDFFCEEDRQQFLDDIRGFLHKYALCNNQDIPFSVDRKGGMVVIKPPKGAEVLDP